MGNSLEDHIRRAEFLITEWYDHWDGAVRVQFSGGKDSTVLLHLVRTLYPDVPAVFIDTGLEYPEIKAFVKTVPNVTRVKPKRNFAAVVREYGYPVVTKEQAKYLHEIRVAGTESEWGRTRLYGKNGNGH